jgi:hypothetical protein
MRFLRPAGFVVFLIVLGQIAKSYWGLAGQIGVLAAAGLLWLILWLLTRYFESRTRALERELAELDAKSARDDSPS